MRTKYKLIKKAQNPSRAYFFDTLTEAKALLEKVGDGFAICALRDKDVIYVVSVVGVDNGGKPVFVKSKSFSEKPRRLRKS